MTRHHLPQPVIVDESAPVAPAHRPTWWNVNTVRWVAFSAIWVALALALLAVVVDYRQAQTTAATAAATNRRLAVLEQYVSGKGAQRDRENAALNDRITQAICDLLDQLPAGGLLDQPRTKYGCGPGLPPTRVTPGAYRTTTSPAPTAATPRASPTTTSPAPAPASPGTPSGPAPSPTPTRPPGTPPGLLCTALHLLCPPT